MAIKSDNLCIHTKHKGRMKSFPGHIFFVKRLISLNWLSRGAVLYKRAACEVFAIFRFLSSHFFAWDDIKQKFLR